MITRLVCESVSIRGIARILKISLVTVLRKIEKVAASVIKPPIPLNKNSFEMDELRAYIKRRRISTG